MANNDFSGIEIRLINVALNFSKGVEIHRYPEEDKSQITLLNPDGSFSVLKIDYSGKAKEGEINIKGNYTFVGTEDFIEAYKQALIKEIPEIKDRINLK